MHIIKSRRGRWGREKDKKQKRKKDVKKERGKGAGRLRNWKVEILTKDDLETEEVELRQREEGWERDWETGRLKK